mgnify:CR=1 FL=1
MAMTWDQRLTSSEELGFGPKWDADCSGALMDRFVLAQEEAWPELRLARDAWLGCRYREVSLGAFSVLLQYNPARETSVSAGVDAESIRRRPCFLCPGGMPAPERGLAVEADFALFLNPFPIFYPHPVVVHREHRPQRLAGAIDAMLALAGRLAGRFALLYNGPSCGASAPDHLHFQAIPRFSTPLEADLRHLRVPVLAPFRRQLPAAPGLDLFTIGDYGRPLLVLQSQSPATLRRHLDRIMAAMAGRPLAVGDDAMAGGASAGETLPAEPPVNLLCFAEPDGLTLCLFPRRRHRPGRYSTQPGAGVLVSPGAIDLAGMVVTPRRSDFETLDADTLREIFAEVCYPADALAELALRAAGRDGPAARPAPGPGAARMDAPRAGPPFPEEPLLAVGVVSGRPEVEIELAGAWRLEAEKLPEGRYRFLARNERVALAGPAGLAREGESALPLVPDGGPGTRWALAEVTIGVDFHWQRRERQEFPGAVTLSTDGNGTLAAINRVPLETYLECVIASEMRADAPLEFLKAHAIISRSWLLAQLAQKARPTFLPPERYPVLPERRWRWTDRQSHTRFDVCADDHCQRYQGLGRVVRPEVSRAVAETRGQALLGGRDVCDTRFSKCCGGVSEAFRNAWGDVNLPGLEPARCLAPPGQPVPDLTTEAAAREWILGTPDAFCHVRDPEVLHRILPDYDLETGHFYRWELTMERPELERLIREKAGWDPGELREIVPLQRGFSGRLVRLLLVGTRGRLVVGKELEIRRVLSPTHLYSSAFVVTPEPGPGGLFRRFHFRGAGWGHGVGLCQVGAAAMACAGWRHEAILGHYFPGTELTRLYD